MGKASGNTLMVYSLKVGSIPVDGHIKRCRSLHEHCYSYISMSYGNVHVQFGMSQPAPLAHFQLSPIRAEHNRPEMNISRAPGSIESV